MVQRTKDKASELYQLPRTGVVMRISLMVSVLFHVFALVGIQRVLPINWWTEPRRIYRVELLRPPVDPAKEEPKIGTDWTRLAPAEADPSEPAEDTISLDTQDKRYTSYAKAIKEKLMQHWQYPPEARDSLIEGIVLIRFTLDRDGRLLNTRVMHPSAYDILNEETLRTIRTASPYPRFPGSITVKRLHIKASFAYRITSRR